MNPAVEDALLSILNSPDPASEYISPGYVLFPIAIVPILALSCTWSLYCGLVVPIPTLPEESIRNLSEPFVISPK